MRFPVVIRRTGTGYSADVPDLPGCVATGTTVEQTRERMAEAIEMHLDLLFKAGESPPTPSHSVEFSVDEEGGEEFLTWVEADEARAALG